MSSKKDKEKEKEKEKEKKEKEKEKEKDKKDKKEDAKANDKAKDAVVATPSTDTITPIRTSSRADVKVQQHANGDWTFQSA